MSLRRATVVLLCEDSQHECFVLRFLKNMGWETRQMRVEKAPFSKGSAEQWVRERFPRELYACRQRNSKSATVLIAVIDGDSQKPPERIKELAEKCKEQNIAFRTDQEPIAIAVPCRNIETWIRYLEGEDVNENESYPKLGQERKCQDAVKCLVEFCQKTGLPHFAPSALKMACEEYGQRILPVARKSGRTLGHYKGYL